jgi:hypothetical protein
MADGAVGHALYADQADQQAADVDSTDAQAAPISGIALAIVGVEQRVPDGMTFIGADNGGTYDPSTRSISWLIRGGLPPGASVTLSYSASLDVPGSWTNAACVDAVDVNGDHTSDCATVVVTVTGVAPTPTPTVATPDVSAASTSSPTPTAVMPAVKPTLTTIEEEVLQDAIKLVEAQGAPPPQVPVQVPSSS